MNIKTLAKHNIKTLTPYLSARRLGGQGDIWLNANESPLAPDFTLTQYNLNRYPEPQPTAVIEAYAAYLGVPTDHILVTRGGDESIELLIRAFCEANDGVLYCPPTYGMYAVSAKTCGVQCRTAPLRSDDFQLDLPAINAQMGGVKILFICNPNNPTGTRLHRADLLELLEQTKERAIVVVDEAYIEFSPEDSIISELKNYPHLAIVRTLSKAFALAGIRCGFTVANPPLIEILQKIIAPYPLPTPTADIAAQALQPQGIEKMHHHVATLNAARDKMKTALEALPQIKHVFASGGNYLLLQCEQGPHIFETLWQQGIILRSQHTAHNLHNCIRITIGTETENQRLLEAIRNIR